MTTGHPGSSQVDSMLESNRQRAKLSSSENASSSVSSSGASGMFGGGSLFELDTDHV
jgi:hypothetical protein